MEKKWVIDYLLLFARIMKIKLNLLFSGGTTFLQSKRFLKKISSLGFDLLH